jgi:light-regulated signal transduction histidine kinase (bacteriophytochrome)
MIWHSTVMMTMIDVTILGVILYLCWSFFKYRQTLRKLQLVLGMSLCLCGLAVIALFYTADLLTMYVLPRFMPVTQSMEYMTRTNALEAANKELETFSYSVSHDLRAPLRAINGFSQALMEDYSPMLYEQGKQYLDRVQSGAQRMGALIDDLLKLSRVTRGEINIVPVKLSALVQAVIAELVQNEPERKVEVVIAPELQAHADERLIRLMLENLLGNAWKFTNKKMPGRIEFGQQVQNGEPVFYVRDNGAGFDMRYADKLFGAFQRLHKTEEFPGTGIGLATAQRIIRRNGGRVWANSEIDQGATFFFTLPQVNS